MWILQHNRKHLSNIKASIIKISEKNHSEIGRIINKSYLAPKVTKSKSAQTADGHKQDINHIQHLQNWHEK